MDNLVTQSGMVGIFAFLVIKELLNYFKGRNNHKDSGDEHGHKNSSEDCITKGEFERHKAVVQYKDNCEQIVKRIDAAFGSVDKRFDSVDNQFEDVKRLIRNGGK